MHENSLNNLTPFQPGQSGNPNGRPRNVFSSLKKQLEDAGVEVPKRSQFAEAISILVILTEDQLKAIVSDPDKPMALRIAAKELLGKKGFDALNLLLDRGIGRATLPTEIEIPEGALSGIQVTIHNTVPGSLSPITSEDDLPSIDH